MKIRFALSNQRWYTKSVERQVMIFEIARVSIGRSSLACDPFWINGKHILWMLIYCSQLKIGILQKRLAQWKNLRSSLINDNLLIALFAFRQIFPETKQGIQTHCSRQHNTIALVQLCCKFAREPQPTILEILAGPAKQLRLDKGYHSIFVDRSTHNIVGSRKSCKSFLHQKFHSQQRYKELKMHMKMSSSWWQKLRTRHP